MASHLATTIKPHDVRPANDSPPASPPLTDMPPLFRFRLRHLFFFVTMFCTLLAGLVVSHGLPALAILLAALVITFHVFSTALGTQLRQHTNQVIAADPLRSLRDPSCVNAVGTTIERPNVTQNPLPWYFRSGFPFPMLPRLVAVSTLFGGGLGGMFLAMTIGHRISPAGLVVGTISVAALSGWFAFVAGSFYGIVREGLREVAAEQKKEKANAVLSR